MVGEVVRPHDLPALRRLLSAPSLSEVGLVYALVFFRIAVRVAIAQSYSISTGVSMLAPRRCAPKVGLTKPCFRAEVSRSGCFQFEALHLADQIRLHLIGAEKMSKNFGCDAGAKPAS